MIMRRTALLMVPNGGFLRSRHSLRKRRHTWGGRGTGRLERGEAQAHGETEPYLTHDQRNHHGHEELGEDGGEGNGGRRAELEGKHRKQLVVTFNLHCSGSNWTRVNI